MADAGALKALDFGRVGSTPTGGTMRMRLIIDSGIAGGLALWLALSYLDGGFYGIGTVFIAVQFAAAFGIFCLTLWHIVRQESTSSRSSARADEWTSLEN